MIRNFLKEKTKINSLLLPLSRAENTFESAVIDSLHAAQPVNCDQGLAIFLFGDDTGTASALAGTIKLLHCTTSDGSFTEFDSTLRHTISTLPTADGWQIEIAFSPQALHRYRKWELVQDFTSGSSPAIPSAAIEILSGASQEPVS